VTDQQLGKNTTALIRAGVLKVVFIDGKMMIGFGK
jgi:hypothetical protein